jgi:WhiB family transcriptional regulator, redox-sensing transcriptional regulator
LFGTSWRVGRIAGIEVRVDSSLVAIARVSGVFSDQTSWARVIRHARCAAASLDPDQWFPVSADAGKARQEAAAAIAICTTCPVRAQCLAFSLRHWEIGQHGVWGGLVAAERAAMRRPMRKQARRERQACPPSGACTQTGEQ